MVGIDGGLPGRGASAVDAGPGFGHEALLYGSRRQFLDGTLDFITEGLAAGEPQLVVLAAEKIAQLRDALGADAARVGFADMAEVGANPSRIIPAWCAFATAALARGGPFRGIGEPIWAERSAEELVECQRHESLLNLAFAETPGFRLLCPYDTTALDWQILEEAHRSHPHVVESRVRRVSPNYQDLAQVVVPFDRSLPEPSHIVEQRLVVPGSLDDIRTTVIRLATETGLTPAKIGDLVIAVNEVVTNTIVHGGGHGILRLWRQGPVLVCEVRDEGRIADPLVGRMPPTGEAESGRGMWLATQLCDMIQVRSFEDGSAVRLHMRAS